MKMTRKKVATHGPYRTEQKRTEQNRAEQNRIEMKRNQEIRMEEK